jgi:hypothetical protein
MASSGAFANDPKVTSVNTRKCFTAETLTLHDWYSTLKLHP